MDSLVTLTQFAAIAVGLAWLFALLATPRKTALHVTWAVFCGSLCLMLAKAAMADSLGSYRYLVGMGACATCNVFWLVSRALFRTGQPFQARHILFAAALSAPIVLGQLMQLVAAQEVLGNPLYRIATGGIAEWIQLLGSGVLLLAFWEGAREWRRDLPAAERRLRWLFLSTYVACALACTLWTSPTQDPTSPLAQIGPLLEAASALVMLLVAGYAVHFRTRNPLVEEIAATPSEPERLPDDDDLALARRIESCVRDRSLYLEPELKVADLAEALATPDYRISRAITLGLGHANFNRFINSYRIDHATRLLSDPALRSRSILAIGIDSGFASIGPFNRAFKASTGQTPSAFRSEALDGPRDTAASVATA
ncbi:helix-turn-helix domain-containing protein [Tahibacter amnicola]|uniref:Helix-turn-helix domain-containing protein n=1 Tax=Tahibacter amnicola TaxID=2976241 RepID=A0ABY6B6Z4_9GAMM|nr:helix-turn-helix domain-containing protein [Tahibacter amnicola]UXI65871.1 helix-turn-helix domain-containing protein [Tahibacter amnicola]